MPPDEEVALQGLHFIIYPLTLETALIQLNVWQFSLIVCLDQDRRCVDETVGFLSTGFTLKRETRLVSGCQWEPLQRSKQRHSTVRPRPGNIPNRAASSRAGLAPSILSYWKSTLASKRLVTPDLASPISLTACFGLWEEAGELGENVDRTQRERRENAERSHHT